MSRRLGLLFCPQGQRAGHVTENYESSLIIYEDVLVKLALCSVQMHIFSLCFKPVDNWKQFKLART